MRWETLRHFRAEEFGPHHDKMQPVLLLKLDNTRHFAGVPIYISDSFREGDTRSHGKGFAVDVTDDSNSDGVSGAWVWRVVTSAIRAGFNRIGIYDKHVHLDCDPDLPPEVMWGGKSS